MNDAELAREHNQANGRCGYPCFPAAPCMWCVKLAALLARVRLEEAEHIQFEVNWRLGNALLSEDPKIKEAHKWLKEHLARLRVPLEQAAGGSAAGGGK